jgi:signal transduction histidine kinase
MCGIERRNAKPRRTLVHRRPDSGKPSMRSVPNLSRANEQFIANVAHQLRYPLVPIRNAAALLKREAPDPATIRQVADIIERQTSGMHRLIGDLLEVSRLELGALTLHRARAPLFELMEQAMESCAVFANERGHTLFVSVTPTPVYLHMDVLRLSQALHHIIINACKYTDKHGHIRIRAQQEGMLAVITVSDTGDGILPAELEAIFELFVQSEHGRRVEPGLGLGLYLARHLIEAHGGTVIAESAGAGRGSVFTIRLPCEIASAPTLESADEARAADLFRV